jgi:hypothetical protein
MHRTIMRMLGMLVMVSGLLLGDGLPASEGDQGVQVELDAFSGRPNPTWTLPPQPSSELLRKLKSLPATSDAIVLPDLGFRGFVLRWQDRTVRVYQGRVVVEAPGLDRVYRDTAGVEAILVEHARQQGYGNVVGDSPSNR